MISTIEKPKKRFPVRNLGWFLLLLIVGFYVGISDARKEKIRGDFSEFTLRASKVMMAGYDPYNKGYVGQNYKYFPTNALLVWPLSKISVYAAQGIWFALNLGLLIWAFKSLHAMLRPIKVPWWVTAITIAISFRLMVMNLRLGQWNTSAFSLSIIGLRYLHQGARVGGSLLLALGVTLKYMPVIFLGYLVARRRWKDLAATSAGIVFWIILFPVIILGPARTTVLMKRFYENSTARVEQITTGERVNSQSVHSALYRMLSPVAQDNDDQIYYVNILNLPQKQAATIATIFSIILFVSALTWLFRQNRHEAHINEVGTLLIIGMCYTVWYMTAPGVRHAQLIGIIPLTFGIGAAAAVTEEQKIRYVLLAGLAGVFLLYTSPAKIVDNTTYNRILEVYGVLPFTLILETMLGLYAYYKVGTKSYVSSSWYIDKDNKTLLGTPKF